MLCLILCKHKRARIGFLATFSQKKFDKNLDSAKAAVRNGTEIGDWFHKEKGSRQGDPSSPIICIIYLERIIQIITMLTHCLSLNGLKFNNLEFADDIDLLEESLARLQVSLEQVTQEAMRYDLNINIGKIWHLEKMPQLYHSK